MEYYFIRVNGESLHGNPRKKDCFVAFEPAKLIRDGYTNYLEYCFEKNIVRMGWPGVGDLRTIDRKGAMSKCYDFENETIIKPHIRTYLLEFLDIQPGAIILVPNRDRSGDIYICEVTKPYSYETGDLYECAHRVDVSWDRGNNRRPLLYRAENLGVSTSGGWWLRAFHEIKDVVLIDRINRNREKRITSQK